MTSRVHMNSFPHPKLVGEIKHRNTTINANANFKWIYEKCVLRWNVKWYTHSFYISLRDNRCLIGSDKRSNYCISCYKCYFKDVMFKGCSNSSDIKPIICCIKAFFPRCCNLYFSTTGDREKVRRCLRTGIALLIFMNFT